jgi:hypothetical protein
MTSKNMKKVPIGWYVDSSFGSFAFGEPVPVIGDRQKALSNRAVQACPAINELENRLFEVRCPYNLHLEIEKNGDKYDLFVLDDKTRLDHDLIAKFVTLMPPKIWRKPDVPVIQISSPYIFVCDETCYMTQMPPFLEQKHSQWPGILIAGRFDIKNWLRPLNWAFEWTDTTKPLRLRKNDVMYYLNFETNTPASKIDLFRAKITPEILEFKKGAEGMPKFTSNTFKVMEVAAKRRPAKLLERAD